MSSLSFKFQPSSTPPSDRFWWGVLLVLVLLVVLVVVTGVKQSQLLVLRLSLDFDKKPSFTFNTWWYALSSCVDKTQPSFGVSQNCIKIFPLKDLTLLRALFSYIRPNLCGCLYHLPLSGILEICSLSKLIKLFSKCCYCTAIFDLTGKSIGYIILKVISICYR